MKPEMNFQISDVLRCDFRTADAADKLNSALQAALGFPFRYQIARIAIALSLANTQLPVPLEHLTGKPIKGETLFGQEESDGAYWLALIIERSQLEGLTRRGLQDLVGAHWKRGIDELWTLWGKSDGDPISFLLALNRR